MQSIQYTPIGIIHTPIKDSKDAPRQSRLGRDIAGTIEIDKQFEQGLTDLETFSHIVLVFHLHLSKDFSLMSKPPVDDEYHGVFATRSPRRPNPIGISVVRLERVEGNVLYVRDVDMVDGTPVLDIKPYVPEVNTGDPVRYGWLDGKVDNG